MFWKLHTPRETKVKQFATILCIALAFAGGGLTPPQITLAAPPAKQALDRQDFTVDGRPAFIIVPAKKPVSPTPWVLYAPTLGRGLPGGAEAWMFQRFLNAGIAIAGVDVGESYGSPKGRATYNALHTHLTKSHGFAQQACLLARSRGGLMLYCWAVENPEKVRCIVGIYPVCNIASYPGLKRACGAYGMTESELAANLTKHNPVDRLASLARAGVPIFHIHGNVDKVVPLDANSGLIAKRYQKANGKMELKIAAGQGHNMWKGFFECQELVDFTIRHATSARIRNKNSR
ncbi:MAG: prolyl oligopeptidase family serine peptidase [Pirellulales bacterium]